MKFNSYKEYVVAAKEYFNGRDLKVSVDLMILPEELFNKFNGIIEFGPGSKELVNKLSVPSKSVCNCKCTEKCKNHKEIEGIS